VRTPLDAASQTRPVEDLNPKIGKVREMRTPDCEMVEEVADLNAKPVALMLVPDRR